MNFDWQGTTAVAALVLSQLPPIRQLIRGKHVRLSVADIAYLYQIVGNTNLNAWIDLENTGGKAITIRRIDCVIANRADHSHVQTLTARSYWQNDALNQPSPVELPFPEIALRPGDRWSGLAHFVDKKTYSRSIEAKVKGLISKIREDISGEILRRREEELSGVGSDNSLVEAHPETVREIRDIAQSMLKLSRGEYELLFAVFDTASSSPRTVLGFDLTLFENDIFDFTSPMNDFKYGFGLYISSRSQHVGVEMMRKREADGWDSFKRVIAGAR